MTKLFRRHISQLAGLSLGLVATLLIGADLSIDSEWARLEAMPRGERKRLWENLQRFDKLRRPEQQAAREIDHRLSEVDNPEQKTNYLSVLRRYHLWFESLPEVERNELLDTATDDRMALVSKLVAKQKAAAKTGSPLLLLPRIADLGSFSPIDMAMIYKVWQGLAPADRAKYETLPPLPFRNQISRRSSKSNVTPAELLPAKYKEAEWVAKVEKRPKFLRVDQITKGREAIREEKKRHLALNLYFLEHPPKPVADARLAQFLSEFPAVVRSTFDVFPPEEIKRRLAISYRLVFPNEEIPAPPKPGKVTPPGPSAVKPGPGPIPRVNPTAPVPKPAVPAPKPAAPSTVVPF